MQLLENINLLEGHLTLYNLFFRVQTLNRQTQPSSSIFEFRTNQGLFLSPYLAFENQLLVIFFHLKEKTIHR